MRNKRKIRATVDNADALLALDRDTDGGFAAWLSSQGDFEETVKALRDRFAFLGDFRRLILPLRGPPAAVPSHEDFRASRAAAKA